MKPQDFIHELNRMCTYYKRKCEENHCELDSVGCYINCNAKDEDFAKIYDTVAAWSDAHPVKTRQSEFLKKFPNAKKFKYNNVDIIELAPCVVDSTIKQNCSRNNCNKCTATYWLSPIDEPVNEGEEAK